MKRGATYTTAFTLSNDTNMRLRFRASTGDYWYDEHNARITGQPGTLPRSASTWVQFSPAEIVIEPQSSAPVQAIITVPALANGSYYTTPIFEGEQADTPAAPRNDGAITAPSEGTITASVALRIRGLLMLTTEDAAELRRDMTALSARRPPPPS